jgi:N-acyl-D-amino-acid deacylase
MATKILIKNGNVIDGGGAPGEKKDLLIEDGEIAVLGAIPNGRVKPGDPELTEIDAAGKIVCPGFIDMHAHSDFSISADGTMAEKVRQGFTSVVIGSCGFSGGPVNDVYRRSFRRFMTGMFGSGCGFGWNMMGEYLDLVRRRGIAANVFPQAGFGNLKIMTMGMMPRAANAGQIEKMKSLLSQAIDEGARGFSTGLVYPTQRFSSTHEVRELCRIAAKKGAIYSTHVRDEMDGVEGAMREAIEIARDTGVSLQVSHHKAILKRNWGKPRVTMGMLEQARKEGVDAETDVYPYNAFSNMLLLSLTLKEPGLESEIIFLNLAKLPQYEGKTLADVMRDTGKGLRAAAMYVLMREGISKVPIAGEMISEEDVRFVISHPLSTIGSDGVECFGRKTHPRLYATTVRVIEKYVLQERIISMEDAIRKMTSQTAAKLKLKRRGLLKEGYIADVVVFDPARIHDLSTYANPCVHPVGFEAVIVNGGIAVLNDEQTLERAGHVL